MDERRKFRRISADLIIMYVVQNNEKNKLEPIRSIATPITVDISMGGIKISNEEFIPKDTNLKIILSVPPSKQTLEIMGKVAWTKRISFPISFETGIEFLDFLTDNKDLLNQYIESR